MDPLLCVYIVGIAAACIAGYRTASYLQRQGVRPWMTVLSTWLVMLVVVGVVLGAFVLVVFFILSHLYD